MTNSTYNNQIEKDYESKDELDLSPIYNLIFRNKFLITSITLLFFLFFCIFALLKKKVWEGNFEIVLENNDSSLNSGIFDNSGLSAVSQFIGISSGASNLETEVGILESPSVLMPVFQYVNEYKKVKDPNSNLIFSNWKKNDLKIELKKGTSILNIAYRDSDRDLIIPVLDKISETYQDYSGISKRRNIKLAQDYLENQINEYKIKSSESLKIAQEYALEQDLTILDLKTGSAKDNEISLPKMLVNLGQKSSFLGNSAFENQSSLISNTNIESVRVSAANEIRKIDLQIEQIENIGDNYEELENLIYLSNDIGVADSILNIDNLLYELNSKYTEKDPQIQRLKKKRIQLIKLLKQNTIGYLKFKRLNAIARRDAAVRPKGVILKYKSLIREAGRDESTLIALENQFRQVNLEASRIEDPWQLITKPTLKIRPVAPNKISIGLLGILLGAFSGIVYSIYREKKSDVIFEKKFLNKTFDTNMIDTFNIDSGQFQIFDMEIFFNEFVNLDSNGALRFIFTNNINKNIQNKFKKVIDEYIKNNQDKFKSKEIYFEDNFALIKEIDKLILISNLKNLTFSEINNLKIRLQGLNRKLHGFILLENRF